MRLAPRIPFDETVYIECNGNWIRTKGIDLSLFGVKVQVQEDECEDRESIRLKLPVKSKPAVLRGRFYRKERGRAVILFEEHESFLADTVGRLLTDSLQRIGRCPYCRKSIKGGLQRCGSCGMPLDFSSRELVSTLRRIRIGDLLLRRASRGEERTEEKKEFIGTCSQMKKVFELIRKYASTDYPVLILGETGTGKELTARAIHERSVRKDKPFIAINCAAIPRELVEAELFGYERGAFTGADRRKKGKVELADGGTLFLDEIGELPLEAQAKLLRFLEDFTVERLGGTEPIKCDVRIIAATNRNLEELVKRGEFREDLYYRLKVLTIKLPPLRERGDDVVIMAKYFLERFAKEQGKEVIGFTDEALELIKNYSWPGNVRELINVIRKAVVLTDRQYVDVEDLDIDASKVSRTVMEKGGIFNLREHMDRIERDLLEKAYKITGGNISRMASMLGVSRPTIYKLLEKHNISQNSK
ncbi:MAG: sigma-54 dependent transcriptional regulator [Aquificota bacterium]|nr:sigma-54 dependent transcriptional regulator [Aquificota bacterium]